MTPETGQPEHKQNETDHKKLLAILSLKRHATKAVIMAERLTATLWRIVFWTMFFAALWMLEIPAIMGIWGSGAALISFISGLVWLALNDVKEFKTPTAHDIDRKLEQNSHLQHRPLSINKDTLANPAKAQTKTLWDKRITLFWQSLPLIRTPAPVPVLARKDPYALRVAIAALFIIGLAASGPLWSSRITKGLFPFSYTATTQENTGLVVWITPPEYTKREQIIIQGNGLKKDSPVQIADGSIIKIRITDGIGRPYLVMDGMKTPLKEIGQNTYGIETPVIDTARITIKQGFWPRLSFPVTIIKDTPPTLTVTGTPETLEKGQLQFPLTVMDDYGVEDLLMSMNIDPMVEDRPLGNRFKDTRAVMSPPAIEQELQPLYDLTWHPWAGLPVIINMEVTDHAGHRTHSTPLSLTLPERTFRHPVAKELIANRKKLVWTPEASAREVSEALAQIMIHPELFQGDPIVFLSLRTMASRLYYNQSIKTAAAVIEQLWDTAIRIEDGNIALASRNLREAMQDLEQTLSNPDATQEEIARKMDAVRQALAAYFLEMAKEMQKNMAGNDMLSQLPADALSKSFTPQDMESFLDQLQSEAFSGEFGSAREMLSQLQKMMDMLDPAMSTSMPDDMQFIMEGISELQKLIQKQEELLERTREQGQEAFVLYPDYGKALPFDTDTLKQWNHGQMPPVPQLSEPPENSKNKPPPLNTKAHQVEQDALRYVLGQLMLEADERLGEIPENMSDAEQEMRLSGTELGRNRPDLSIPHQEKALEYLQDSMEQMSKQLQARMSQMMMFSFGGGMGQTDPLGRPFGEGEKPGWWPGSKVKIPEEAERKRVQEILDILRKRAGERDRPDYELDYYNRLLRQF